ncbi:hypothetical protein LL912_05680 [Niabella sp. CC-SYL272]|uniref:hypothetical protein n=1 Tax=Niabella agricola TaxID=2891571 RepID=UPI001F1B6DD7|nr:hypothetical protein [Niabella agricola]MCF3108262.1 hypothetical protein [Niabella agricola]
MAIDEIPRLLTVAQCDAALQKLSAVTRKLTAKQHRLEDRVEAHRQVISKTRDEIGKLQWELSRLHTALTSMTDGRRARECRCRITLATGRIQQLELRLEDRLPALAMIQFDLGEVLHALEQAAQYRLAYEANRSELLQEAATLRPETAVQPESAAVIPLIPAPRPAADQKPAAPQPVARLFQKQKGRRWMKARPVAKRAV